MGWNTSGGDASMGRGEPMVPSKLVRVLGRMCSVGIGCADINTYLTGIAGAAVHNRGAGCSRALETQEIDMRGLRPGDILKGDVYNISQVTGHDVPHIRIVKSWVDIPNRIKPISICASWNLTKLGPVTIGDSVDITLRESPFSRDTNPKFVYIGKAESMNTRKASTSPSRDRVNLFIGPQYYRSKAGAFVSVLTKAFGIGPNWTSVMLDNPDGFYVVCRPSQFARFMIYRNDAGISNGFRDLTPKLFVPQPKKSPYEIVADKAGVCESQVRAVMNALAMGGCELEDRLEQACSTREPEPIDVSANPHCPNL